jgi:hypothetical protein
MFNRTAAGRLHRIAQCATVLLILPCAVSDYAQTQTTVVAPSVEARLNQPLPKGKTYANKPLQRVIEDSLFNSQVPGGVAYLPPAQSELLFTAPLANPSYRAVFNAITAIDPRYKWEITEGTINFIPVSNYPELLDTTISEFNAEDLSNSGVVNALEQLPEVQQRAKELGFCTANCPRLSSGARLSSATLVSVHSQNRTLREILNSIARANGNAVWSYSEGQRDGQRVFNLAFPSW